MAHKERAMKITNREERNQLTNRLSLILEGIRADDQFANDADHANQLREIASRLDGSDRTKVDTPKPRTKMVQKVINAHLWPEGKLPKPESESAPVLKSKSEPIMVKCPCCNDDMVWDTVSSPPIATDWCQECRDRADKLISDYAGETGNNGARLRELMMANPEIVRLVGGFGWA